MKNVYTVGQVNAYIKNMFAQDYMLRSIVVAGEVSNVKYHSSGHIYFTMKDKNGAISCVMFAGYTKSLQFRLTEGMQIESTGSVNVYERSGSYQLYVTEISLSGAGALYEKYEKLKEELKERGMFDAMYKQPIPKYAMTVGVVTAATGAAVQDIMQIAKRRNPFVQLVLYSARVQGDGAKESIVAGIKSLEQFGVDVIIVGRGGGSIEDLWAFNEECVAQAIFDCSVPIVSAVGHETDTTIADYVADLRAPTPSAAAELTVFSYKEYIDNLDDIEFRMHSGMIRQIEVSKNAVKHRQLRLEALSPQAKIQYKRLAYMNMMQQLDGIMNSKLEAYNKRLAIYIERMKALSPLERLQQGYAFVTDEDGHRVNKVSHIKVDDKLSLAMADGIVAAKVTDINKY